MRRHKDGESQTPRIDLVSVAEALQETPVLPDLQLIVWREWRCHGDEVTRSPGGRSSLFTECATRSDWCAVLRFDLTVGAVYSNQVYHVTVTPVEASAVLYM